MLIKVIINNDLKNGIIVYFISYVYTDDQPPTD